MLGVPAGIAPTNRTAMDRTKPLICGQSLKLLQRKKRLLGVVARTLQMHHFATGHTRSCKQRAAPISRSGSHVCSSKPISQILFPDFAVKTPVIYLSNLPLPAPPFPSGLNEQLCGQRPPEYM